MGIKRMILFTKDFHLQEMNKYYNLDSVRQHTHNN